MLKKHLFYAHFSFNFKNFLGVYGRLFLFLKLKNVLTVILSDVFFLKFLSFLYFWLSLSNSDDFHKKSDDCKKGRLNCRFRFLSKIRRIVSPRYKGSPYRQRRSRAHWSHQRRWCCGATDAPQRQSNTGLASFYTWTDAHRDLLKTSIRFSLSKILSYISAILLRRLTALSKSWWNRFWSKLKRSEATRGHFYGAKDRRFDFWPPTHYSWTGWNPLRRQKFNYFLRNAKKKIWPDRVKINCKNFLKIA